MNVSFVKVFDKYELAVIEHNNSSFEVRVLLRNLPVSFPICNADQSDDAYEKANRFLDMYEAAKQYNFQAGSSGMINDEGHTVSYDDLFVTPPEQLSSVFEGKLQ
ncbi:hypothetical protein [Paenibacillus sp. 1P07SE]|uniref:hypothetical protein n=1 Tax=Paenibacillus sp. 1P07SE TaxID=3132209 RepID=UPI0039A449DF